MEQSTSATSGLVDIITNPSKALIAADTEPKRMWLPFVLAMLIPIILSVYYFSIVDMDWMFQQVQAASAAQGQEVPEEAREFMTSTIFMGSAVVGTIVMVAAMTALSAFYLLMVAKFTSEDTRSFGKWFSLSAWSSVPNTLAALLMIIYFAAMGNNQMGLEDVSFFSANSLLTHYPSGTPQAGYFGAITPFLFWSVWLVAMGLKLWTDRTMGKSLFIAALPYALVYGIWGVVVL